MRRRMTPNEQALAVSHMPLAKNISSRYARYASSSTYDDLLGCAYEALCLASISYDARKGRFAVYAAIKIKGEVRRALSQLLTGKCDGFSRGYEELQYGKITSDTIPTPEYSLLVLKQLQRRAAIPNNEFFDVLQYHEFGDKHLIHKRRNVTPRTEQKRQRSFMRRLKQATYAND